MSLLASFLSIVPRGTPPVALWKVLGIQTRGEIGNSNQYQGLFESEHDESLLKSLLKTGTFNESTVLFLISKLSIQQGNTLGLNPMEFELFCAILKALIAIEPSRHVLDENGIRSLFSFHIRHLLLSHENVVTVIVNEQESLRDFVWALHSESQVFS